MREVRKGEALLKKCDFKVKTWGREFHVSYVPISNANNFLNNWKPQNDIVSPHLVIKISFFFSVHFREVETNSL